MDPVRRWCLLKSTLTKKIGLLLALAAGSSLLGFGAFLWVFLRIADQVEWQARLLALLGGLAGLHVALLVAGVTLTRRHLVRQVRLLEAAAHRVEMRHYSTPVEIVTSDELGDLSVAFNRLLAVGQQAENQLRRQVLRLQTLREIDRAVSQRTDVDQVLKIVLQRIPQELGADAAAISLLDERAMSETTFAMRLSNGTVIEENPFIFTGALWQELVVDWRHVIIGDLACDPRVQVRLDSGLQVAPASYLGVPLVALRVVGVLHVLSTRLRAFAGDDVEFFATLAGQVAVAIQSMRTEAERVRLSSAVKEAAEPIIIAMPDGTITNVNRAFEEVTGYSAVEAVGQTPRLLKSGVQERPFYEQLWSTLLAGRVWRGELVNRRKNGSLYTVKQTITPIRGAQDDLTGFVSISLDVTESRSLEAQLRQAQKMEAIGRMAGGIAHDFNNLLTAILGYAGLLLDRMREDDTARGDLAEICRAAERAAALTSHLLAFSRRQVLRPVVVDLNAMVEGTLNMLRRIIGEDIEIATSLDPAVRLVRIDPTHFEQVLLNLAVNARDAMPDGGVLAIETAAVEIDEARGATLAVTPGRCVRLRMRDTGCGMDDHVKAHLFEPFFTTKEPGKGTGLGLSMVYGVVKQSGGTLEVKSAPGHGTSIDVYLPCAAVLEEMAPTDGGPVRCRGAETILLVEDEDSVRSLLRAILVREGYQVLAAGHGEEAIRVAAGYQGPIHLLLADVVLPGMSGCQLADRFRVTRPDTSVLYVSGYPSQHAGLNLTPVADTDLPATDFLPKPFTADALVRKVREVLDRTPA